MHLQGFRIMSENEMAIIHQASMDLLINHGVRFDSSKARKVLIQGGANVDNISKRVMLSKDLIENSLATVPNSFFVYNRTGTQELEVGGADIYMVAGVGATFIFDPLTNSRQSITLKDIGDFARLADFLPNIHFVAPQGVPGDVPAVLAPLRSYQAVLNQTTKPNYLTVTGGMMAKTLLDMAQIVIDPVPLSQRPFIVALVSPTSPLIWGAEATDALIEIVHRGIPLALSSEPLMGISGPVTPEGSLVLANAELLAGVVLAQLVRPGSPVIMAPGPSLANMRNGLACHADPSAMIARLAGAHMARFYHIPGILSGPNSDSLCLDVQNGWERAFTTLAVLDSGCHMLVNTGLFAGGNTSSFEQMILDNELFGYFKGFTRGITISTESLAIDVIENQGPGGNFLRERHTRSHFRESWQPGIANREPFNAWSEKGKPDIVSEASRRAKTILSEYPSQPLPEDLNRMINQLLSQFEKEP
jgi:trimethylamine---corrinoid protein Co-methyltransferase